MSLISLIILLIFVDSGVLDFGYDFVSFILTLQNNTPNITGFSETFVNILTYIISFSLVGLIFNKLRLFNSKLMSFAYFIISTIIGFILSTLVHWIIDYYLFIVITVWLIAIFAICNFVSIKAIIK